MIEINNETKGVSFSKRLFFNKQQLPIGFIEIRLQDKLKITVSVTKTNRSEEESTKWDIIQQYVFQVREDALQGLSDNCLKSEPIPIHTWAPTMVGITLNYDG